MTLNYISRKDARKAGLTWYFVGASCRKGHVAKRFVSNAGCSQCQREQMGKYRAQGRVTKGHAGYLKSRSTYMLSGAKKRAQRDSVPFELTLADIVIPEVCPVLGIRLASSSGRPSDASPSLDRVRPEQGYVRGNAYVISNRANRIKMNATSAELRAIADWMDRMEMLTDFAKRCNLV